MRQAVLAALILLVVLLLGTTGALWVKVNHKPPPDGPRVTLPPLNDTGEPLDAEPAAHPPHPTFRVAAIQAASLFGEPEANRKHLSALIEKAANAGAQVVVLPEAAVSGYLPYDLRIAWQLDGRAVTEGLVGRDPGGIAETIPGDSTRFFAQLASRLQVYLTVPLVEVDRKTGRLFNTIVLLGPNGALLRHYRKKNPWLWAERGWATPGDLGNPVIDTPYGRLGMLICFDIHEQAKILAEQKVDTLLYSIAWVDDENSDWFNTRLPAIAQRYNFNVVGANWTVPDGTTPAWHGYGHSLVINKFGKVLAKADQDDGDEVVLADLPVDR
jgi:predicted amidohydrolase